MPTQDSYRRHKHRKKTDEKLDLNELSSAPNLGGMLSFLAVPPEEARRRQVLREAIEAERSGRAVADSHEDQFPSVTEVVSQNIEPHRANDDEPTVGHMSTVVDQSTVGHIPTVVTEPILFSSQAAAETTYTDLDAPTVVHRPPVGADCTGAYTPTVGNEALSHYLVSDGRSPTEGLTTTVGHQPPEGLEPMVHARSSAGSSVLRTHDVALAEEQIHEGGSDHVSDSLLRASGQVKAQGIGVRHPYSDHPTVVLRPTVDQEPVEVYRPTVVDTNIVRDPVRKARVFRATLVQHGHTPAEQLLYLAMWSNGREAGSGSRQITAGYRQLAHLANLNDKTVKYALQSLVEKLAIQVIAEEHVASRTGRTYCVFSYEQILARRNQAGLVWVRKNKGVEFVEAPTVVNRPTVVQTSGPSMIDPRGANTTARITPTDPVVHSNPRDCGFTYHPFRKYFRKE